MKHEKRSQHPYHDDPSAFYRNWASIEQVTDGSLASPLAKERTTLYYRFGKLINVILCPAEGHLNWFMSIHKRSSYPTWDEVVYLRYNLIPDSADMAMKLPPLDSYINNEKNHMKNVFTLEATGWALNPVPICETCAEPLQIVVIQPNGYEATFICKNHVERLVEINLNTWNESHGNGYHGRRK